MNDHPDYERELSMLKLELMEAELALSRWRYSARLLFCAVLSMAIALLCA